MIVIRMDNIKTEAHLCHAITYIMKKEKTEGRVYSNSGVTPEEIFDTFLLTKKMHPTHGKRQGYHFKFSFSKDETISKDDALAFIKEWVQEYLKDKYDYVLAVHSDRELTHMHLVFNSVKRTGGKYRYTKGKWKRVITPLTNRLCEKYHTGMLKEKENQLDYSPAKNWKKTVETDMAACLRESTSYEDFKGRLQSEYHYKLREGVSEIHGVYWSLTPPGKGKAIRTYQLAEGYMPADIEKQIGSKAAVKSGSKDKETFQVLFRQADGEFSQGYFRRHLSYRSLSSYQKYFANRVFEAKRLYHRTNTLLKGHEQSVRAIHRMMNDMAKVCRYDIRSEKDLSDTIHSMQKMEAAGRNQLTQEGTAEEKEKIKKELEAKHKDLLDLKEIQKKHNQKEKEMIQYDSRTK